MKFIDVDMGMVFPEEGSGYVANVAFLASENVSKVVWPEEGSAGPWIEREPFEGRERSADLLVTAEQLMADAETQHNAPEPAPSLEEQRKAKLYEVNAAYQAEIDTALAVYPKAETLSFDKQEREARTWVSYPETATPFLDALVATRGIDKQELVNRVIAKADGFAQVSGAATGKRQALEDQIKTATEPELESIQW